MEIQDSVSKDYSVHDYKKANVQRIDTYNFLFYKKTIDLCNSVHEISTCIYTTLLSQNHLIGIE